MARVSDNIIVVPFVSCAGVTQVKSSCEVHLWCVYNGISRENHLSWGGGPVLDVGSTNHPIFWDPNLNRKGKVGRPTG